MDAQVLEGELEALPVREADFEDPGAGAELDLGGCHDRRHRGGEYRATPPHRARQLSASAFHATESAA